MIALVQRVGELLSAHSMALAPQTLALQCVAHHSAVVSSSAPEPQRVEGYSSHYSQKKERLQEAEQRRDAEREQAVHLEA